MANCTQYIYTCAYSRLAHFIHSLNRRKSKMENREENASQQLQQNIYMYIYYYKILYTCNFEAFIRMKFHCVRRNRIKSTCVEVSRSSKTHIQFLINPFWTRLKKVAASCILFPFHMFAFNQIKSNQTNLPAYLIHMFAFFSFFVRSNKLIYTIHILTHIVFSNGNFVSITSFLGPIHLCKVIEIHSEINQLDGSRWRGDDGKRRKNPNDYPTVAI